MESRRLCKEKRGTFVIPQCKSLNDLLREYVDLYGKDKWSVSTYERNTAMIGNYIRPMIDDVKIADINTRFLEKYYQQLLQTTPVPTATPKKPEADKVGEVRSVISISCFTVASNRQLSGSLWKRTRLPMQPFRNTNRRKGTSGQRRH